MAKCEKCNGDFASFEYCGIKFEICKGCGTIVISKENFEKLTRSIDSDCKVIDLFAVPSIVVKKEIRVCTQCNAPMEQVYCEGVLIDRCPKCNLLVFDNGELSKYFSIFSKNDFEIMSNIEFLKKFCKEEQKVTKENYAANKMGESKTMKIQSREVEKRANYINGWAMVLLIIIGFAFSAFGFFMTPFVPFLIVPSIIVAFVCMISLGGFKTLQPQEAMVMTLFGKYVGTIKEAGFFWINPFAVSSFGKISLKARTLDNGKQKINDVLGNPIDVGIMVTWEVNDTAKAVFNVNNFSSFLSAQCDSALRNIVRLYPYDAPEDSQKQSLKDDSEEISEKLKTRIQECVSNAGLNIVDARITHLAYSSEIAMAMLQRQQANAVIDAKRAIVDGAVGMVEMAIDKLSQNKNIVLDDKTKASMVNNLLVILCGNKDTQPVIRNDVIE